MKKVKTNLRLLLLIGGILVSGYSAALPAKLILTDTLKKTKEQIKSELADSQKVHVLITAKPAVKSAIFKDVGNIGYNVKLSNGNTAINNGLLDCFVTTDEGEMVFHDTLKVNLAKFGKESYSFKIVIKDPGFYKARFKILNTIYKDSVIRVFGVNTIDVNATSHKPDDFESFWAKTKDSLRLIDPKYKITEEQALAVNNKKVYLVEMHSWDDAVIYGWLTIPNDRPKRIPVKLKLPPYLTKMEPTFDDNNFAVFSLDIRGSGISRNAVNTRGEFNLYHINDQNEYIYRAVYMDCVRGLDFLWSHGKMGLDSSKILVEGAGQGAGLAVALAGLDKRVKLLTVQNPLYSDFRDAVKLIRLNPKSKSPVTAITEYLKNNPKIDEESVLKVWDYFDPLNFAPAINCPVLLSTEMMDDYCPPKCAFILFNKMKNKENTIFVIPEKSDNADNNYTNEQYYWAKDMFRIP